jgi:hypothetical protein
MISTLKNDSLTGSWLKIQNSANESIFPFEFNFPNENIISNCNLLFQKEITFFPKKFSQFLNKSFNINGFGHSVSFQ